MFCTILHFFLETILETIYIKLVTAIYILDNEVIGTIPQKLQIGSLRKLKKSL